MQLKKIRSGKNRITKNAMRPTKNLLEVFSY
jgi:hypothetical protein